MEDPKPAPDEEGPDLVHPSSKDPEEAEKLKKQDKARRERERHQAR